MAINRQKKEELVAQYKKLIANSSAIVFTHYQGTKVAQLRSLRNRLSETNSTCTVVKNTLLRRALTESGRTPPDALLSGANAVVFCGEDIARSVTALKGWIKDAKALEITGALLENSVLDSKGAELLSDLPTKDQTRALLLGVLSAPARQLVQMLAAPGSSLVRVVNAHAEKQSEAA